MGKVFVKKENECYSLLDNITGEVTELKETVVVDDEQWLKLYASLFLFACDKITGQSIKVFIACMKHAFKDEGEGNLVCTNNPLFAKDIEHEKKLNLSRCLKELCVCGLLKKVKNAVYRINPQVAYLGKRSDRAKLILQILKEPI
jgi:hypothetical protein